MTDYPEAARVILAANAPLVAALTGGILLRRSIIAEILSRTTVPTAYNSTAPYLMKPHLIIADNIETEDAGGMSDPDGFRSNRQRLMLNFYADQSLAYSTLKTAADMAYALLHKKQIGGGKVFWRSELRTNDTLRENARLIRVDYEFIGQRS